MRLRTLLAAFFLLAICVSISASALPDLIVSEIKVEPAHPQIGQPVFIEATISNCGLSSTEGSFFAQLFIDGREVAIQPIAGRIASGDSKQIAIEWIASAGVHFLSVEVDSPISHIDESNEANNTEVRTLTVVLNDEAQAAVDLLRIAVAPFDDRTNSGFFNIGAGTADKLIERLVQIGVRVLDRSELEAIMQDRGLNPSLTSDLVTAARLLGADVLITGSVTDLDILDSSFNLGFLSVSGAEANVSLSACLINAYTMEIMAVIPAEGHDEGTTGFSVDLTGFLSMLQTSSPDICGGGLQTARSWYNVDEPITIAYRNPGAAGWFSIEITTGIGSFVRWLGWRYIDADDCDVWTWDQLDTAAHQMSPAVYSAKLWDGTAYVAEVGFQIRPGISLSVPSATEMTAGTESFDATVVGSALDFAMDDLIAGVLTALQEVSPVTAEQRTLAQFGETMPSIREGQIAAVLPDGRIAINIGASSGVAPDEFFEVLDVVNVVVDPQSLEILSYDIIGVRGEIAITEVRDRVSFGVPTSQFEPIIGDIVRSVSP